MKSLKAKLIIKIITFILIFDDAYAGNFKIYISILLENNINHGFFMK